MSQYDVELKSAVQSKVPNMARIAQLSGLATQKGKEDAKALQAPGSKYVKGGRRRRGTNRARRRHRRKTHRR